MLMTLDELLAPMLHQKRLAIIGLRDLCERRALRSPAWWAWTVWLAHAITVRKIESV
jgi:hypothetical protein